jgi:hypothetical protein
MPQYLAPGVYVEEIDSGTRPIEGVSTSTTGFVGRAITGPLATAVQVKSFTDFERSFGGFRADADLGYAVTQFFANGGQEAWIVRVDDDTAIPRSLAAFDDVASIALLSIPGCAEPATLAAALAYCDSRRAFLVVDPAVSDPAGAEALATALRAAGSANAAVYFPRVLVADPLAANAPRAVPAGGAVAGMMARVDLGRGVWRAPAGTEAPLSGTIGVEVALDDVAAKSLLIGGVNPIRSFPVGVLVWAAHTISSQDRWRWVNVRRLFLFVERSIGLGIQWAVFEPDDPTTRPRLRFAIRAFLADLWRRGALQGGTVDEAFVVECGPELRTEADVTAERHVVLVGFVPVASGALVLLRFALEPPARP